MIVFPLVAAGVSGVFAFLLLRQYATRKSLPQLAWGVALAMFSVASLLVAYGGSQTWDPTIYRLFWLFGVMLNVPWLAVGSIALLGNETIAKAALAIVCAASLYALVATFAAHPCLSVAGGTGHKQCVSLDRTPQGHVFGGRDIPTGKDVWASAKVPGERQGIFSVGILYSVVGYVIVILIAVLTSRKHRGVEPPAHRRRSNLLIATGVTIVAVGSTALSRFARGAPFSICLAAGVAVMFVGFLKASPPKTAS